MTYFRWEQWEPISVSKFVTIQRVKILWTDINDKWLNYLRVLIRMIFTHSVICNICFQPKTVSVSPRFSLRLVPIILVQSTIIQHQHCLRSVSNSSYPHDGSTAYFEAYVLHESNYIWYNYRKDITKLWYQWWYECMIWYTLYYNMTVWILARNDINFSMAAGLIRLHMPGVK